jgi:proline dehydrogenase
MLRSIFSGLAKAAWTQRVITSWEVSRRVSRRFVAGETIDEAIQVVRQLNLNGINATLDHLGENTTLEVEARAAAAEVLTLMQTIYRSGVRSNVSVKLSQIGLTLDEGLCRELLEGIVSKARELGNFVRIDMEGSDLTERTLKVYEWVLDEGFAANVGIVLQAYLYRTGRDLEQILAKGGRVRLCKGAYQEPNGVAFANKRDVNLSFDQLALRLLRYAHSPDAPALSQNGRIPPVPAIATHDPARIAYVRKVISELGVEKTAMEFQMLYGIRRDLQDRLKMGGYPVRVYVPYRTHWYPYFMRRLGERPANLWFFISNYFRR